MGFAPTATITQGDADSYDPSNNQRVSWNLYGAGGWRLGSLKSLNSDSRYYKVILIILIN